jgi:hypothetical protein
MEASPFEAKHAEADLPEDERTSASGAYGQPVAVEWKGPEERGVEGQVRAVLMRQLRSQMLNFHGIGEALNTRCCARSRRLS